MEGRYQERLAEFQKRIHKGEAGAEQEMYDYMAECIPLLMEFESAEGKKKDVYEKYMMNVEGTHLKPMQKKNPGYMPKCKGCGSQDHVLDDNSSDMICTKCGMTDYVQCQEVGFKEEQDMERHVVYSYRRENHFNEWVNQFQAKESTSVPKELIEQLQSEVKKQRIKDKSDLTHRKVREMLKKIHMNKYYEHAPYITTILNGVRPPTMPQALEDRLRLMFGQIQKPFEKHCPENRKNFLSYSYVLYKFCELLGEDQYLPCFPLLKSKDKLYRHDVIWKKITTDLGWEFFGTC
jgi:Arc/MetJ-type ribon-helix-helix transcriptional regulator/ribosomal protein S27E